MGHDHVVTLISAPGHLLRRAQQVHTDVWRQTVPQVTGPQYAVLVAVAGWEDTDQKTAGDVASLDKATAAGVVGRLCAAGWLVRREDPTDRRRRILGLTEQSHDALPGVTRAAAAVQDVLLSRLQLADRERFIVMLDAVARIDETLARDQVPDGRTLVMRRSPGYLLRRAQQLHAADWATKVRDLTGPQYAVLAAVLTADVANQGEISVRASLDASSTGDVVVRLLQQGWLEQVTNVRDQRQRPVRVTVPAMTALRLLKPSVQDVQERLVAPLCPADRSSFIAFLQLVADVGVLRPD